MKNWRFLTNISLHFEDGKRYGCKAVTVPTYIFIILT